MRASVVSSVFLAALVAALQVSRAASSGDNSSSSSPSASASSSYIQFTRPEYRVSIPENSVGRVFAVPEVRMGVDLSPLSPAEAAGLKVRFKVRSGDPDGFFKADSERVGDFVFLVLRTKTSNRDVLNRERRDSYRLEVRARVKGQRRPRKRRSRRRRSRRKSEHHDLLRTVVRVRVTDTNDLDPFFQPSRYSFEAPEDAPLFSSVGRVRATDADEGVNGEIYYSILEEPSSSSSSSSQSHFAVDPMSGVVFVSRPLAFEDRPRHALTVAAQDRGAKPAYASRQADTAEVSVQVKQVRKVGKGK